MIINICTDEGTHGRGFFSLFNQVLHALDYADQKNEVMMVDFNSHYGIWEDFFMQPFSYPVSPNSDYEIKKEVWFQGGLGFSDFFPDKERCLRGKYLIDKYIRFNFDVIKLYEETHNPLIRAIYNKKKILGIHIRQSDHFMHGALLPLSYYMSVTKAIIHEFDYIYLATDSLKAIDLFENEFPGKVIYLKDAYRTDGDVSTHMMGLDKFKSGCDVIFDVLNLSKCDFLLKTVSNVSNAALYFNPKLMYTNIDTHIAYK